MTTLVLALSISATCLSIIALGAACWAGITLIGIERSKHTVQYVPLEAPSFPPQDETLGEKPTNPELFKKMEKEAKGGYADLEDDFNYDEQ
jgi:hypothetical protein